MAELPFILAGPILRRVTPRFVSVWVALSKEAEVKLTIWDQAINTGGGVGVFDEASIPLLHTQSKTTTKIGSHLHIVVVAINLEPTSGNNPVPLIAGKLYSYNLRFTVAGSPPTDLKSNQLLVNSSSDDSYYGLETDTDGKEFFEKEGNKIFVETEGDEKSFTENGIKFSLEPRINVALGYTPDFLPSFVIPPLGIDGINLAHGSCRNAAGFGKDCLAALDFKIKEGISEMEKRPHQLFLTGDQIYADVFPVLMMGHGTRLGNELLGFTEKIKLKRKSDNTEVDFEVTTSNFPVQRREKLVNTSASFTCKADIDGFKINHLLSFGEYAATYLMYWSNAAWSIELFVAQDDLEKKEDYLAVWDTDPPTRDEIDSVDPALTPAEKTKKIASLKSQSRDQYDDELPHFIEFRTKLPFVRRVLANVPVLMIMDDHEVTDDWYITKAWKNGVLTSTLGVNILRNALMAYTLFQDWGNDSVKYDETGSTKKELFEKIQLVLPDRSAMTAAEIAASETASLAAANDIDILLGFNLGDETPPPVKWHYTVPCGELNIHVLDTRTRRTYETINASAGLLSDSAMDDQIPMAIQPDKLMIFVSPAPVLGLATIEEVLQPAVTIHDAFSKDPEPWSFCPPVFEKFLKRLEPFKKVVFLSGDSHFGI
jgi:hypothetical protein